MEQNTIEKIEDNIALEGIKLEFEINNTKNNLITIDEIGNGSKIIPELLDSYNSLSSSSENYKKAWVEINNFLSNNSQYDKKFRSEEFREDMTLSRLIERKLESQQFQDHNKKILQVYLEFISSLKEDSPDNRLQDTFFLIDGYNECAPGFIATLEAKTANNKIIDGLVEYINKNIHPRIGENIHVHLQAFVLQELGHKTGDDFAKLYRTNIHEQLTLEEVAELKKNFLTAEKLALDAVEDFTKEYRVMEEDKGIIDYLRSFKEALEAELKSRALHEHFPGDALSEYTSALLCEKEGNSKFSKDYKKILLFLLF